MGQTADQVVQLRPRRTLAARLEERDRDRFAARQRELSFLDRCLEADDPPASVVHVTGPGGIGKSALLREVARHARARGFQVVAFDGRDFGPAPVILESALREAASLPRPLVLLDSYERMTALDPYLRRELLPSLPERALVVIAGRGQPDPGWFAGGWEAVSAHLTLSELSPKEAENLLRTYGLADDRVPAVIDWAAGSPLALALAADVAATDAGWSAATQPDRPDILRSLLHRLVETELRGVRPSAIGVAVVARTTTPQLLRTVLPDEDAEEVYRELSGLSFCEPLGDGIAVHDLVRKALHADLRQRNPELEQGLRRKIVDYLYQCASDGQPMLIIEMAHLVENPLLRWGFSWDGSSTIRIDAASPGDADRIERQLDDEHNLAWWDLTREFFTRAPDLVAVARDLDDRIQGYMAYMSQASAPKFADDDPLIGPWLAHARKDAPNGDSVLWHASVDLTGTGKVQAMLGIAGVLRSGVANPRYAYLPIDVAKPGALGFAMALNASHIEELDADVGGTAVECHRVDFGPGGLIASLRAQVYAELGLPASALAEPLRQGPARTAPAGTAPARPGQAAPEAPTAAPLAGVRPAPALPGQPAERPAAAAGAATGRGAAAGGAPQPGADVETVREALRNFGVPRELARSPLARGETVGERAESVRALLRGAAGEAFGDSGTEKLLRSVLVAGYLEPAPSHEAAAARLCLSRAAYFRRLRTAVERLAEHIAASGPAAAGQPGPEPAGTAEPGSGPAARA